jgi:hypothetical protein
MLLLSIFDSIFPTLAYTFLFLKSSIYIESKETEIMAKRNDMEHKALSFIANIGNEGVLQSDLWRQLGASSREGSRIALKLEDKGMIQRQKELCEGRWTYRLYPKRKPASINSIADCPCLTCQENLRCGSWGATSPNGCEKLTDWILKQASENLMDP